MLMSNSEKVAKVAQARILAKWFKIEFTLSLFGKVILHWVYPPQVNDDEEI